MFKGKTAILLAAALFASCVSIPASVSADGAVLNIIERNVLDGKAQYKIGTGDIGDGVIIAASYNEDGTLYSTAFADMEPETTISADIPDDVPRVKIMAVESLSSMKPLCVVAEDMKGDIVEDIAEDKIVETASTYSSVSAVWNKPDNKESVTGYNVYINGDLAARTAADETYYTAENLEPDTEYMVKVTAVTADDENTVINTPIRTDKKGNVHNVLDEPYNAKGDGKTLDTDAIQSAIDSCETNDIVLIPEGYTFLTGALDLKSNMTLEVNGTLLSSKNAEDFEKRDQTVDTDTLKGGVTAGGAVYNAEAQKRLIWSRSEGWEQYCYRSLINIGYLDENTDYSGEKSYVCENVKICGTGTITGDSYRGNYAPINGNATALAIDEGKSADEFYDIDPSATDSASNAVRSRIRGRMINISNAKNVYIKGITVEKPPMWTVHMIYSDNIVTNGVTINTSGYRNGDGWDPDSSTNCTIYDSVFNTGDDCVAIKSGKNPEGNEVAYPAENINVIGCKSDGGLGLAVGSEMSGGVSGVYVRDCVLSNTRYGIEIKANAVRGGYVRDFNVEDSTIDQVLIHSVTYNADGDPADSSPVFSDMSFKNVNIIGYDSSKSSKWIDTSITISGFEDESAYVSDVLFENVVLGTENNVVQNVSMKNCRGIEFNNVRQSDGGIPFYSSDKAEFTVDGGKLEDIVPSFVLEIEAEKMNLSGYKYESNSAASAGACVSANDSGRGTAKAEFGGDDGIYDLTVQYFDENDGKAEFEVYVNDELIDSWTADQDLGSASADSKTLTTYTVENVTLKKGDVISITGVKEKYDPARLDKLTLVVK